MFDALLRAAAGTAALLLVLLMPAAHPAVSAQVDPIYSRGIAGLVQALESLQTTASAMHTGAHPDDEDTALIARLARGDHARVAYLSLNRGEGGQNIIGLELFDALGVIRTEELLQARTLDGGDQFFTRAFDFGFTKTLEEAAERWGEEQILGDMVRAIRRYRPLVLLAGFSGTPADGHGQHQLAGKLTPLAFHAAGDPARFPEHLAEGLRPWAPRKLYARQGFRPGSPPATLRLPTGVFDPLLGRSYFEIAMEGRSQHKSQEMGVIEVRGPKSSNLRLLENRTGADLKDETGVFDGIDTSLAALPALAGLPAGALAREIGEMQAAVDRALASPDLLRDPTKIVPFLADGLRSTREALAAVERLDADENARAEAAFLLRVKEEQFEAAIVRAAGLQADALSDRELASPGEEVRVSVNLFLPDSTSLAIEEIALDVPDGWKVAPAPARPPETNGNPFAAFFREEPTKAGHFLVTVPEDAKPAEPYWLEKPREGAVFDWTHVPRSVQGLPFAPPLVSARIVLWASGQKLTVRRPLEYRFADAVRGEIRRNFAVAPALTLGFEEPLLVLPTETAGKPRRLAVRLESQTLTSANGTVRLAVPDGWAVSPAEAPFTMGARGEREAVVFTVTPPASVRPGAYPLSAEAKVGKRTFAQTLQRIEYPHIQTHRLYDPAAATARVLDLKVKPVRVGYVMGGGDQVPDAIRRMGLEVTLLTDDQLASSDLSAWDTIVVGIRASESRPAFVANNGRLLQYVRNGGTLIVQYQQTDYTSRGLVPLPASGATRVTDETAPVKILAPDHPVFTTPNRIGPEDWEGWVQERNLYAFANFDPQYQPLLETRDPGEEPQRGGQLYLRLGKGHYVYTSYAWFRQLPAGVPGAYRMFANLLSLGH
ncbi:MAG TPA: PIG-L family deacetylase [Vicinamibacterales bacterium]